VKDRLGRVMNDPSFVYGEVYGPMVTVERSIVLLQVRLAQLPPETLTLEFLDEQYSALLKTLVSSGLCVVTSFTQPTIEKTIWFAHQRSQIDRFRE